MQQLAALQGFYHSNKRHLVGIGTPIGVLAVLAMVILPMPPILLDILFSFNITLSMLVLLVAMYTRRPLDFAAFPAVLLITTVFRLALNIASTRVVLLHGQNGPDAAGAVIEAFGSVVVGGNFTVGLVVFLILIIINFVVITKGAGRISEVTARFTLDAMPGKQMAIDADLNSGLMSQEEARIKREDITREADFYGAMDGASKFVKGDAIAGLLILAINVVGGILIGTLQYDLAFAEAGEIYTLLSIGDGLVAQIPSLLLSVATALIITRENADKDMGEQINKTLTGNPRVLIIVGSILFIMGIVPGMPHLAFLGMAALCIGLAYINIRKEAEAKEGELLESSTDVAQQSGSYENKEISWDDVHQVDTIGLEVGYRLIPMVDKNQGGELLARIKGVRKKLSQELGFLVSPVHIRDNLDLEPNLYRITLLGVTFGEGEIRPDWELAINPGQVFGELQGEPTKDPAFGLDAIWIRQEEREHAQTLGYTVVDSATVVATHLSQILTNNAAHLVGHEEAQQMLDLLAKQQPKLVEGLVPDTLSLSTLVKVLQNLLEEGVPVRDFRTIAQTLAEYGGKSQDPDVLTSATRIALRRMIVQEAAGGMDEVPVITLSPELEQMLHQSLQMAGNEGAGIEPGLAERVQNSIREAHQQQEMNGQPSVLLTSGLLRKTLSRFTRNTMHGLHVLSYQEIPDDKHIRIVSSIGQ